MEPSICLCGTEFFFLRHGQTDWNREGRIQGQIDVVLNEEGKQEAKLAATLISPSEIDMVFASPLKRAIATAQVISKFHDIPLFVIEDLKECNWGVAEGLIDQSWMKHWLLGSQSPEGAEPFGKFQARSISAINNALKKAESPMIVAHTGTYWALTRLIENGCSLQKPSARPVRFRQRQNGNWEHCTD